ncbi:glutathione S-transferase family protein [Candidatus Gracilibacteria bacterium]|jgi:GSH-dependent disulfide-bond oxidoreductase|nr:glutathione S-transferase family protein [Candidatus Gracilibacteria bacterium]NJM86168.1 glutathione S-transferase family protein [Hydrococcus sp. RU_2_2]NJP19130.1 glutathione S-transferase family protein [Hydrococcus sp. CRU_1_1]NJQ96539.1 glutathione S-transferase family protein [Hydrococcus sp. CSU_1_8]
MITLYAHGSPNPHKISIALEEFGLPYKTEIVDVWNGDQFKPAFVALNPNSKVPVIVDYEAGQTIYESNAILLYLAEKTGKLFPKDSHERWKGIQLLFFQAASIGPMFGQRAHFSLFATEKPTYAVERYIKEGERLTTVMENMLANRKYFLDEYSIVDIAHFGWLWCSTHQGFTIDAYPNVKAWFDRIAARPAVQKGVTVPLPLPDFTPFKSQK